VTLESQYMQNISICSGSIGETYKLGACECVSGAVELIDVLSARTSVYVCMTNADVLRSLQVH
jgi:hypothetical protein